MSQLLYFIAIMMLSLFTLCEENAMRKENNHPTEREREIMRRMEGASSEITSEISEKDKRRARRKSMGTNIPLALWLLILLILLTIGAGVLDFSTRTVKNTPSHYHICAYCHY